MDRDDREARAEALLVWALALASVIISVLSVMWVFS